MDAARYARIRELFLKTDELSPSERYKYLQEEAGDDKELIAEVLSLLDEHDPQSAKIEGERAVPLQPPMMSASDVARQNPDSSSVISSAAAAGTSPSAGTAVQPVLDDPQITRTGAQRTHASPRYDESTSSSQRKPTTQFWDHRTKKNRRLNSGWLWLAALLPTALVGWWTYRQVEATQRDAIRNELSGLVETVSDLTRSFLDDRAEMVEAWVQDPQVVTAVRELVKLAEEEDATEKLKQSAHAETIHQRLIEMSGSPTVKFMVWDLTQRTLASWRSDKDGIGVQIRRIRGLNLSDVWRGNPVLYGPENLEFEELLDPDEVGKPMMAHVVPVFDEKNRVVAAMMIRGISMFDDFDQLFREASTYSGKDVYVVDRREVMLTNSPQAMSRARLMKLEIASDKIASNLRVCDPGFEIEPNNIGKIQRSFMPLTYAVAGAITGKPGVRIENYNNYAGVPVVGAWRWDPRWEMGVIVEHDFNTAFAPTQIVRLGFFSLGILLVVTGFAAASKIARQTMRAHAAVHPLSRYEVVSELGSGGMGVVYRARHRQLGRETALKLLRGDRQNKDDQMRFDREARLAASLSNPHSVMIYDYGRSEEGEAFCVMEYLHGITLYEVVMRSGHQSIGRTLYVLRQICESLAEAHQMGLLHRDIKPQNVMLSLDQSVGDWAVVFDFGLAKSVDTDPSSFQTTETVWAGTPMYMAPERYREPGGMDPRSDIYSLGCVAYFLLSGRPPYVECDPESLFALVLSEQPIGVSVHRGEELPGAVVELVDRCMAKRPIDRYTSVREVADAIDQLRLEHPWSAEQARDWWRVHGEDTSSDEPQA